MTQPALASVPPFSVQRSALNVQRSTRFRLVLISPESADPREHAVLARLFAAGLTDYHLRKPSWSRDALAAWLRALPEEFHRRIVLHSHHDLAAAFTIGGLHHRDEPQTDCHLLSDNRSGSICSQAVHSVAKLRSLLDARARLLFSPVFPSISKPGHGPAFDRDELHAALAAPRRAEVIALGGVDATRVSACRELGFDGVAVLGAVWQAADPVAAFRQLQAALQNAMPSHPAPDSGLPPLD